VRNFKPWFLEFLRILTRHRVDFIIAEGVSAVLYGAPVSTFGLDIVHARNPDNVQGWYLPSKSWRRFIAPTLNANCGHMSHISPDRPTSCC
jgi:hypothetical protein